MSEDSDMASERVDIAALRSRVETFESPIEAAIREKYGSYTNLTTEQPETIIRGTPVMRFSLLEVFDSYLSNDSWVQDRLPKTVDYLFDLKLQLYYLTEIELGIYNQLYHSPINADPSLADSPRLLLIRLSLDQNLIGKSRIFWERVMNLVYYLEKGEDLETKKSKKKAFFNLVEDLDRWRWLASEFSCPSGPITGVRSRRQTRYPRLSRGAEPRRATFPFSASARYCRR